MENSYTKRKKERNPQKRFKDYFSCMKQEEGYMTFLACMLFLVISALLFLCLDGSLVYQAKARASMAETGLTEHLMANYNVPLSKRYHLYFLDPRMNEAVLKEKGEEYYAELFGTSSVLQLFSSPLWRMETEYMEAVPFGTMQEKEFQYFITQIEDYMKHDLTKDLILKAFGDTVQETEKQAAGIEETANKLDKTDSAQNGSDGDNTLTPSEVAEGELAGNDIQKNNPLQKIRSILEHGLLGIVAEESELSDRKIAPSLLPFKNQSEKKVTLTMDILKNFDNIGNLIREQGLDEIGDGLLSQGTVNLYIQKYFNYYGKSQMIEDTSLLYEMEYILGGQNSDIENLEYVVNRLVLLRFALNASYAFGNEELRAEALSMAAVLTGITGTPEFLEPVRYIILAAVNLIESVMDVNDLLEGDEVPLVKNSANWKTSISGGLKESGSSGKEGLTYQEYTLILLMLQTDLESKCYRMQNLMELNIKQEEPDFRIKECRAGIKVKTGIKVRPVFYLNPYVLEKERKVTY